MQIRMQDPREWTTEQMRRFLEGTPTLEFQGESRTQIYGWIKALLIQQEYSRCKRAEKGTIRVFLSKVTGRSLPQITRLIRQYLGSGDIVSRPVERRCFPTKYTPQDVALLADVDRAHQRLSGPATRRIFQREFQLFGKRE